MTTYGSIEEISARPDGAGLRIGIVVARFNARVADGLLSSCTTELTKLGVKKDDIKIVNVPGALELPLALQKMAQSSRFEVLIALGAVIRGETYHFEIVAGESSRALIDLAIARGLALGNGILTVENEAQAEARADPKRGDKGGDAARAAIALAALKRDLAAKNPGAKKSGAAR